MYNFVVQCKLPILALCNSLQLGSVFWSVDASPVPSSVLVLGIKLSISDIKEVPYRNNTCYIQINHDYTCMQSITCRPITMQLYEITNLSFLQHSVSSPTFSALMKLQAGRHRSWTWTIVPNQTRPFLEQSLSSVQFLCCPYAALVSGVYIAIKLLRVIAIILDP